MSDGLPVLPPEDPPVPLLKQLRVARFALRGRAGGFSDGKRPFLIYGQGRSGSTLLGSLLASHPEVVFGNEVLRGPVRWPVLHLDGLRASQLPASYGVHVKPYHLTDFQGITDVSGWLRYLGSRGWLLVHLSRTGTLRQVLSNFSRRVNGTSHFSEGDGRKTQRVRVNPEELLQYMDVRTRFREQERRDLAGLACLEIEYERDLLPGEAVWTGTALRIFEQLGLPPHQVSTSLRRINQGSLSELVLNWDEVADAVAGSRFAGMLVEADGD